MKTHHLKMWPVYFAQTKLGNKNFEIRKNDRDFHVGDVLILEEFDITSKKYTGNTISVVVTYTTFFGCADGYIVMGVRERK